MGNGGGDTLDGCVKVSGVKFDAGEAAAQFDGGDAGCPAAHKRVEDDAARRGDEAAEVAHKGGGLDGAMNVVQTVS